MLFKYTCEEVRCDARCDGSAGKWRQVTSKTAWTAGPADLLRSRLVSDSFSKTNRGGQGCLRNAQIARCTTLTHVHTHTHLRIHVHLSHPTQLTNGIVSCAPSILL